MHQPKHTASLSISKTATEIERSTPMSPSAARYLKIGLEKAPNTVRAYRADLNCYTRWCEQHELTAFPATAEQVVNYLSEIAEHYKVATLGRRLAMLSSFHDLQNMESPTSSKLVRTAMDGIKRSKGIRQHQAPAMSMETFQKIILSFDEESNTQLRDKIVLLLGFTGAFRRGELAALNVGDLLFDEEGILVDVRQSKTDQLGAGQLKAIFYASHPLLCPVRTIQRYLKRIYPATVQSPDMEKVSEDQARNSQPVLLRMRKGDRFGKTRLSDKSINLIVQRHFGSRFSAHSLRASFVTISKKNGASNSEIMAQTFHKTETMIRRYTRFEDARTHNAGTKLGL